MVICLVIFDISFLIIPSHVFGEEVSEVITTDAVFEGDLVLSGNVTTDAVFEGDLVLSGNATLTVRDCVYNVTGFTTLKDQARLMLYNATFITDGLELQDFSLVRMESSTYGWGIKASGYTMITIVSSHFPTTDENQLIELNDASMLRVTDSMLLHLNVLANDQSDVTFARCGPDINIQTSTGSSLVDVRESFITGLTVFGGSQVYAANSTLGDVFVAYQGVFIAESCLIINRIGYYDYNSRILLSDCWVRYLIDGIIYRDQSLTLSGEDIRIGNYSTGAELIDCNVTETDFILFLLGEEGKYHLDNLTSDVLRVLIESGNVTAEALNVDDLVFYIGRESSLYVWDSTFNRVIGQATWALILENCKVDSIIFSDEMIQLLRIFNSTIVASSGPAIFGGWLTDAVIDSSTIRTDDAEYPDMLIIYLNQLILRDSSEIELQGEMGVKVELYDSDITLSNVQIESLHNNLNSSRVRLMNDANYSKYTTKPPNLVVKNIKVDPKRIKPGEQCTVSAEVFNEGELLGVEVFVLYVDGEAVNEKNLSLAGGASKTLSFTMSEDGLGKHVVRLGDAEKGFVVSKLGLIEALIYAYGPVVGVAVLLIGVVLFLKGFRRN